MVVPTPRRRAQPAGARRGRASPASTACSPSAARRRSLRSPTAPQTVPRGRQDRRARQRLRRRGEAPRVRHGRHRHDRRPVGDPGDLRRRDRSRLDRDGSVLPGRARRVGAGDPALARTRRSSTGSPRASTGCSPTMPRREVIAASLARPRRADPRARPRRGLRHRQPHCARAPRALGRRARALARADPPRRRDLRRPLHAPKRSATTAPGPNHVLPTSRTARFSSPLGVYDFQKRSSMIEVSRARRAHAGPHRGRRSRSGEGLQAHARSAELRLESEASERDTVSAGPADLVRDDVRAMTAYHVPAAAGMVKLDAMENPYRLPEPLREEIAERRRRRADQSLSRSGRAGAEGAAARRRWASPAEHGPPARQRLRRDHPDHDPGARAPGRGRARARAELRHVPHVRRDRRACATSACRSRADFTLDGSAFLAAIDEHRPAVVFIAYPNNPTGNLFPEAMMRAIVAAAPGLVVIDEAYHAFAGRELHDAPRASFRIWWSCARCPSSGWPGMRLGYAAARRSGSREFDKVRPPYNVNVLTQLVAERLLAHHEVLDGAGRSASSPSATALLERLARRCRASTAFPERREFHAGARADAARQCSTA